MHHMTLTMCPYSPCVNTLLVQPLSNHLNSKGRLLQRPAAGSFDGSVFVWELAGGTVAATLRGSGTSPVLGAAWSPQVPSVHSWHTLRPIAQHVYQQHVQIHLFAMAVCFESA